MNTDILSALDAIKHARVAVVGDVMLDRYVYGSVARLGISYPVDGIAII